jgi:hypothetical protein
MKVPASTWRTPFYRIDLDPWEPFMYVCDVCSAPTPWREDVCFACRLSGATDHLGLAACPFCGRPLLDCPIADPVCADAFG